MNRPLINVLIVEDNAADVYLLQRLLATVTHIVLTHVEYLDTALHCLTHSSFAAILLDLSLPDSQGLDTVRKIHAAHPEIPIVVLTGVDNEDLAIAALREGAQDYLVKGDIQRSWLVRAIQYAIERQQSRDALQQLNQLLAQENQERLKAEQALKAANAELKRLVGEDDLTGVANRRKLDECLQQEWRRCVLRGEPLAFILCDLDYFKAYNDHYGHPAGDHCLRQVAQCLKTSAQRVSDLVARYGGEEFSLVLPNTHVEGAMVVAQRIQRTLAALNIPHAQSPVAPRVTLSLGIAINPLADQDSPEDLMQVADQALYQAKEQGRNRIVTWSGPLG